MRRALVTGGSGQLASDLSILLGDEAVALSHDELDITDADAVGAAMEQHQPELVLNCAAFHNVDACERDPDTSWQVNVEAVRGLAKRCAAMDARLVHFSTNYAFDGRREAPYGEADLPSPRSVYGLTKLAGEYAALAYCPAALVVRSAGLYGEAGSASKGGNFVDRVLARARDEGQLRMVDDQRLQPTFTTDLARAVLEAVETRAEGVVHLTASTACSWYEFAMAILEIANVEATIEPLSTAIPEGSPDRPLNGVLARPRADELGLQPLRPWTNGLADYLQRTGDRQPR